MRMPLLVSSMVFLSACAVGPDYVAPLPPATTQYVAPGEKVPPRDRTIKSDQYLVPESQSSAPWWTRFRSPRLDAIVTTAISGNHTLEAANATLSAAQEQLSAAGGGLLPSLAVDGGVSRQKVNLAGFGFAGPNPTFNLYSVGTSVSYGLDIFGGTRRRVEGMSARADAAGYRLGAAYLTLTGKVAQQVILIASLRAQLQAAEDMVESADQTLDLVKRARDGGVATGVDVLTAQSQAAADRTTLPALRRELASARHALSVLVGKAPSEWPAPDFDLTEFTLPAELPVSLPSELVRQRPDILAAEAQLRAANADVGVATARLFPSLTLTASYSQDSLNSNTLFSSAYSGWNIGAGLTQPIFEGGTRLAERRASKKEFEVALAMYRQTVLDAFAQVADILQALASDEEEIFAQKQALDAASASFDLTRRSYAVGNVGILNVLDAQRLYEQAKQGYIRAETRRYFDTVQLFLATDSHWQQAMDGNGVIAISRKTLETRKQ
jgi:NodT family efflux transporter outer membrane factor (OMF) lipoprotein